MRKSLKSLMCEHLYSMQQPFTMPPATGPVVPKSRDVPIQASERWQMIDRMSLKKRFPFADVAARNRFVVSLLAYEEQVGHNATITIDENEVSVEVGTRDLQTVTEIDKEYARYCDVLHRDMTYSLTDGNSSEL